MSNQTNNSNNNNPPRPAGGGMRMRGPGMGPPGMGGPPGMRGGEKPKNFKGTMKALINHLKPYIPSLLIVALFSAAACIFSIMGPKIMGRATTAIYDGFRARLTSGGVIGIDFAEVGRFCLILMGLYGLSSLFNFIQHFIISGISQKVSYNFRKEISQKINRMPLKYFDKITHGEVLSRVTNDVDTVSQSLNQSMSQMVSAITTFIGVLVMMLSISGTMTLVALVTIPLSFIVMMNVVKLSQKYFKSQQQYLGHVNGHVEEAFGGHVILKAFNGEQRSIEKFNELNDTLYNSAWKSQFLSGIIMPLMGFVGNIGYVAVCLLGGYLATTNVIDVGDILSFIQYVRNLNQPINQIGQMANVLQSTAAAAERVFEFLNEEEEPADANKTVSTSAISGDVQFKNVEFGYTPDKIVVKNFSANIKPGQKIAIVGHTGAGKTTIVKLLMRFYDLNGGGIYIDGNNINDFKRDDLRNLFGMVLQDTWLFNGTIMENIRYGNLNATDKQVVEAAKTAYVHHFVQTLPDGYNMELNEEASNISQGQKQLLTIARAVLADPKILILDEATSSVDTRTEVLIQEAMEQLMKGRTSFIIAHRLSTIRNADLILVMDNGNIVEQGGLDELLAKKGFYYDLYMSQFESSQTA